jgi:HK97 gp10 family phage protein
MGWRGPTKRAPGRSFVQGAITLSVDDREALRALERLERLTKKRVTQKVLRRAGAPIRAEAKSLVPVKSGELKRSIRTYVSVRRFGGTGRVESRERYAHLVELGTKPHYQTRKLKHEKRKRRVKHPGAKAKPFLRPAFDNRRDQSVSIARKTLHDEIRNLNRKG